MEKGISVSNLMELYLETIQSCGTYLLHEEREIIEYQIFEEFDIGVFSFLHEDNLTILREAKLINDTIMASSLILRNKVIKLQCGDKWNVDGVRNSSEWREVLELTDEIKVMLELKTRS
ncbi:hypothetical protein I6N90_19900 [Paenibacillus sp. GSMTC-2017]|uniref:hypothetical protein n=1 Tax=Paenibacillus sp. GSMTC-2017 TaxID=2794350 RepID=UPI0018D9FDBB|nr:hypothetical protein [Paenibacillus sp. GSMTC-2017]MBH5320070.1 hypothetical protein [Paenibacillus sp. GSMTC-2017]